jgi:hypothetical protein
MLRSVVDSTVLRLLSDSYNTAATYLTLVNQIWYPMNSLYLETSE